jgi:endogenous inhibitor of DNA gyrase (YacG/DUF329 family)
MERHLRCPICRRLTLADSPTFPFCGERCRLVDLGNWLDGRYRIPGAPTPEEEAEPPAAHDEDPDAP